MGLEGKVAAITGGNSGIGRSIAEEYARAGAQLAIMGRNQERLDATAAAVGNGTVAVQGDVTSVADIERFMSQTSASLGKIDVLVANAGMTPFAPATAVDEAMFDQISDINFKGAWFTVQKAIPVLNDGASVILVTSAVNKRGFDNLSVYSAAKAAVRNMAQTFARELAPQNVRVNALSPGAIETPFFENAGLNEEQMQYMAGEFVKMIPMGRFGQADEIAKAALFLASDDSSYMTGSELDVDGGIGQL
jgi:NAD(P)-dependent dehydrogenase (short-subunit alcohol dehydrogenase family)